MRIGSSEEHIFFLFFFFKKLTNNLGYGEIPRLDTFYNFCAVFFLSTLESCVRLFCFYFLWLETLARTIPVAEDTGLYLLICQYVDLSVSNGQTQEQRKNDLHKICGTSLVSRTLLRYRSVIQIFAL